MRTINKLLTRFNPEDLPILATQSDVIQHCEIKEELFSGHCWMAQIHPCWMSGKNVSLYHGQYEIMARLDT